MTNHHLIFAAKPLEPDTRRELEALTLAVLAPSVSDRLALLGSEPTGFPAAHHLLNLYQSYKTHKSYLGGHLHLTPTQWGRFQSAVANHSVRLWYVRVDYETGEVLETNGAPGAPASAGSGCRLKPALHDVHRLPELLGLSLK